MMSHEQDKVTADLLREILQEKRSDRFWKNIRFFVVFLLFLAVSAVFIVKEKHADTVGTGSGYVALVRLNGMIESGADFFRRSCLAAATGSFCR